jgi:hypothetical protein
MSRIVSGRGGKVGCRLRMRGEVFGGREEAIDYPAAARRRPIADQAAGANAIIPKRRIKRKGTNSVNTKDRSLGKLYGGSFRFLSNQVKVAEWDGDSHAPQPMVVQVRQHMIFNVSRQRDESCQIMQAVSIPGGAGCQRLKTMI